MEDWFVLDRYHYSRIGDIVQSPLGVAFRYSAIDVGAEVVEEAMYTGTEVLTVRDGKILTISDYYCDPSAEAMGEVIRLSASRHGQSSYATAGFSAARMSGLRRQLTALIETRELYLDADLTVHELARIVGCTPGQLISLATGEVVADDDKATESWLEKPATEIIEQFSNSKPE